ncbi:MAG: transposase [Streptosporangiaceae bacterium]
MALLGGLDGGDVPNFCSVALFELCEAVLCSEGPVHTLAGLSLAPEHRRGHGSLYDAVNQGRIEISLLRRELAGLPLPRWPDGRIVLAADVSNWLRPAAAASPGRLFCHVYARGRGNAQMIPGWPYSVIAALEPGRGHVADLRGGHRSLVVARAEADRVQRRGPGRAAGWPKRGTGEKVTRTS